MRAIYAIVCVALVGCAEPRPLPVCPAGLHAMGRVELYFGQQIPGGAAVSIDEWTRFRDEVLTAQFPDGFTVTDGSGQWRADKTGPITRETTKVVTAILPTATAPKAAEAVAKSYRERFHQDAVGIALDGVCANF